MDTSTTIYELAKSVGNAFSNRKLTDCAKPYTTEQGILNQFTAPDTDPYAPARLVYYGVPTDNGIMVHSKSFTKRGGFVHQPIIIMDIE